MNSKRVESRAVCEVGVAIEKSDRLEAYITKNDKTPSWDGEVLVYRDSSESKDNIIGKVPVQVKGKVCDDHTKGEISFSMEIADLQNYKNGGGCFLFVVYIAKDFQKTKIYYSALAPIELCRLLRDTKEGQKEKCVKLQEFPSQKEKIFSIFSFCVENFEKQASFARDDAYLSFSDVDDLFKKGLVERMQLSVECSSSERNDPVGAWLKNKSYMYLKTLECKILQPVAFTSEQAVYKAANTGKKFMIEIDGKLYVGGNVIRGKGSKNNEKTILSFLDGLILEFDTDEISNVTLTHKYRSNRICMVVHQLDFLLATLKKGSFNIIDADNGKKVCESKVLKSDFDIQKLERGVRYFKRVEELFKMLHCADDANINDFKDEDWGKLNILMLGLLDKKPVKCDFKDDSKKDLRYVQTYYEVGGLKFMIVLEKCSEKGEYKIYDFFSPDFQLLCGVYDRKCPANIFPTSHFVQLQKNDFLTLSNINFDVLLPSFKNKEHNSKTFLIANDVFLLKLLNAYDEATGSRKDKLLKVCKEFCDWISEAPDDELDWQIKTLNVFQTIKRCRELSEYEIKTLWSIVNKEDTKKDIIVGAYLLLDKQELAKEEFEKLSEEEQKNLKKYPIFRFWKEKI